MKYTSRSDEVFVSTWKVLMGFLLLNANMLCALSEFFRAQLFKALLA